MRRIVLFLFLINSIIFAQDKADSTLNTKDTSAVDSVKNTKHRERTMGF